MKTTPKKKRSSKGKYAPLIWIVTGALIAFFISYSGSIKKPLFQSPDPVLQTNTKPFDVKNLFGKAFSSLKALTNQEQGHSVSATGGTTVKIYVAEQRENTIYLSAIEKPIAAGRAPLKEAIELLIHFQDEKYLNLVPYNTRIRNIWIKKDVVYIDFSEEFGYNSYGLTGYKIQLYQIVYTSTQFPQIKAVYFYMNGKPLQYMGGDGYPVHNPVYPFSTLPQFPLS